MTLQEIRDACSVKVTPITEGYQSGGLRIKTELRFFSESTIDPTNIKHKDVEFIIDNIKEAQVESILHILFEDQRRELFDAINEFFSCSPFSFQEMNEARERIMAAARYQKPQGE